MKPGEKVPITYRSLLCPATRSSRSGVSMATTKMLHQMRPQQKWTDVAFRPEVAAARLVMAGAGWDPARPWATRSSLLSCWFFPSTGGLGEGRCQGNRHL